MKIIRLMAVVVLVCSSFESVFAVGSGALGNQTGVGTPATSHGFAFAGVADDPSAIFYNPAGLVQVKGWGLMTGAAIIDLQSNHTTPSGTKDSMASNLPVAPYFYLSYSKQESPWAFGIGVNSPFGLVTEWKDDSFSKYYATKSELKMYDVNPTLAYSVNERFSVGGGIDYFNVYDVKLNQLVPGVSNGEGQFSGDGKGWGYNLGVHCKPYEKHSFGLSYRSQVNVTVDGETQLNGVTAPLNAFLGGSSSFKTNSSTELKFPQSVLLGYGFHPSDRWTVFADYEWVDWASTKETKFNYDQNNALLPQSIARNWKSTSNVGAGANWKVNERVDLRFGGLVYERVVPSGTLESSIPDSSRFVLTAGPGFHFGDTTLDLGYNANFFNNRTVDNNAGNAFASMDGKYATFISVFNIGLSYRWGKTGK